MKSKALLVLLVVAGLLAAAWSLWQKAGSHTVVSGTLELDEVRLASRAGGRIVELGAAEGDVLTNGQLVALLDAPERKARKDRAEALVAEMVAGPRAEEIEAARREWESLRSELEFAEADAKRADELFRSSTVSVTDRDLAATRARTLSQRADAAKARLDVLLAGTRSEELARARADLDEAAAMLNELRVLSPGDMILETLNLRVGDVAAPNAPIATLLHLEDPWARVFVPEPWLVRLHVGDRVLGRADGIPGKEFEGVIEQIQRRAEFTPRNVQTPEERVKQVFGVKVRFPGSRDVLRPGVSMDVTFPEADGS